MAVYVQTNQPEIIALNIAATQINASDTGKLFLIGAQGQALNVNLPAVQGGLHYRFQTTVDGAGLAHNVSIGLVAPNNHTLFGVIVNAADGLSAVDAQSRINFVGGNVDPCAIGDSIDLYCDGVNWSVFAYAQLTMSITLTA